ncbi:MAG: DMT family transporter [Candidatus Rokuibacteriota bacterium]
MTRAGTPPRAALDLPAMGLLFGLSAIWGLNQVAIKVGHTGISPLTQAGLRSAIAGACLLLWAAGRGIPLFRRDGTLGYGLTIALLFGVEFVCVYWGLTYTTASRAILFIYTAPFVVAGGAHFLLPDERLTGRKALGLACAFLGLVLGFADALRLPSRHALIGDALELVGAILWGATTLVIKARGQGVSAHKTLFYQLAGSAVVLLGLAAVLGEAGLTRPAPLVLGALAYQSLVVAFASYLAWFWLLTRYPASDMTAFTFWTPLFGLAAGALLLGEPITAALGAAFALVAAGIYLVSR